MRPKQRGSVPAVELGLRFEALVFDLDGVLVDTERTVYEVWKGVFSEFEAELPRGEWQKLIGTSGGGSPYAWLAKSARASLPPQGELEALIRVREREAVRTLQAMPGVGDWLDEAEELGLRLGVASSSPREWVEARLLQIGLLERFSVISCPTPNLRAKPAGDLYVAATACLGVSPARAIAIEDSRNGVLAALQAGLVCIAVPNSLTYDMDLQGAHLRMGSLAERSLSETLEIVSRSLTDPPESMRKPDGRGG